MPHQPLTAGQIATLTAHITGGGLRRSATRAEAEKRFLRVAAEAGLAGAAGIIIDRPFDDALDALKAAMAEKDKPAPQEGEAPSQAAPPAANTNVSAEQAIDEALAAYHAADDRGDEWMKGLFLIIFEAGAASSQAARKTRRPAERKPRDAGPNKREQAASLLTRPEGATAREILDLTGWPAVSVPAVARASKLSLRQEKDGKVTRYFGEAA